VEADVVASGKFATAATLQLSEAHRGAAGREFNERVGSSLSLLGNVPSSSVTMTWYRILGFLVALFCWRFASRFLSTIWAMVRSPIMKTPTSGLSMRMRNVATSGTVQELTIRRVGRTIGEKYTSRTDYLPRRPGLFLPQYRIAMSIHGCSWHGCPRSLISPKRNRAWWRDKIERNRRRNRRKARHLGQLGISTLSLWEHYDETRIRRRLLTKLKLRRLIGRIDSILLQQLNEFVPEVLRLRCPNHR
jgi:DNA mismatch endonuclease (patch repair protein)